MDAPTYHKSVAENNHLLHKDNYLKEKTNSIGAFPCVLTAMFFDQTNPILFKMILSTSDKKTTKSPFVEGQPF